MKPHARLIIPLWGGVYANKLVTITLPALLAPGNLPALCENFAVELVIVTETKLFDWIRNAPSFKNVSQRCDVKLVPIDDLITDTPGDYGVVLTYALYRGFTDLGERMTDTYLLFLNADFIISDGSLRHLGMLMQRGERVIHAPSFRGVLEDVWPKLEARVDRATTTLAIGSREMVKLALKHKHITVKARTVNQRLCHQWRMDQFYWYVDENTLIGYQWPVALVAIKPECVTLEPSVVWDYGFVPDAAPTARRHFIDDSDNFFMLEPQKRETGEDLVRLGWISPSAIAADLSRWTTKEQRECGRALLKIHAADLPDIDAIVHESRVYMDDIYQRLSPEPLSNKNHALLGNWFRDAKTRMRGNLPTDTPAESVTQQGIALAQPPQRRTIHRLYEFVFGRVPEVRKIHPLWTDIHATAAKIDVWSDGRKVLWLSTSDSLFYRKMKNRIDPASLRDPGPAALNLHDDEFDACLCDLSLDELTQFRSLYATIRPLVKDGGEIVVFIYNKNLRALRASDLSLCETALPDLDTSEIHFYGSRLIAGIRGLFMASVNSFPGNWMLRELLTALVLISLIPVTLTANVVGALRDKSVLPNMWTSLMISFRVKKSQQ